ncbi:unnamed protein product [Vicia faba]|uniref:Uncharacterized protein n=1 Tax=Vicia faba TaxID=3906 RepID=A0AAV0Z6M3_VICFA|nr:unnamed protein product [Vicia faba]
MKSNTTKPNFPAHESQLITDSISALYVVTNFMIQWFTSVSQRTKTNINIKAENYIASIHSKKTAEESQKKNSLNSLRFIFFDHHDHSLTFCINTVTPESSSSSQGTTTSRFIHLRTHHLHHCFVYHTPSIFNSFFSISTSPISLHNES